MNLLNQIIQLVGKPSTEDIDAFNTPFAEAMITYIINEKFKPISFKKKLKHVNVNEECIDLLSKLLQFNPKKRIDTLTALNHPYFKDIYNEKDIKQFENPIQTTLDDEEYANYFPLSDYRSRITKDISKRLSKIARKRKKKRETLK